MHRRLDQLVLSTAQKYPDRVALEDADGLVLSYAQLVGNAARVSASLTSSGSPPPRVGLLAGKSREAFVGYLGILLAGSTVVPMYPSAPPDRLRAIVGAAELSVVLTDRTTADRDDLGAECRRLPAISDQLAAAIVTPVRAEPTAYVLFTSGSTGRPKGVPISHANALSFVEYAIGYYGVEPGSRMSQTFDFAFDVSVYDLFVAWGSGASLIVPRAIDLMYPARWVSEHGITHWASVPSVITAALRLGALSPGSMPSLRLSLFIGEQLSLEQALVWQQAADATVVENFYGPTELTVAVSSHRLDASPDAWEITPNRTVPIGRIYPHLEYVIIDDGEQRDEGELCVRGAQRFAGYLDPGDNAGHFLAGETFLPLPSLSDREALDPQAWYRTGDIVRTASDGVLTHLGRQDSQVKIHGYRVELGEIEGVLRRLPGVRNAVVVTLPGALGGDELVAFYEGNPVDLTDLRAWIAQDVPAYMVPRTYHQRDTFPLTANGKVDRLALQHTLREQGRND